MLNCHEKKLFLSQMPIHACKNCHLISQLVKNLEIYERKLLLDEFQKNITVV
jgi:hypothetical protein